MSLCHDCRHAEAAHSIPDPEGRLCYGMGSCGNCLICEARLAGPEHARAARSMTEWPTGRKECASAPNARAAPKGGLPPV